MAALVGAGLLGAVSVPPAAADEAGAAAVSRGKQGSTLRWGAATPSSAYPVRQAAAAEPILPQRSSPPGAYVPPATIAPRENAMADPFGDRPGTGPLAVPGDVIAPTSPPGGTGPGTVPSLDPTMNPDPMRDGSPGTVEPRLPAPGRAGQDRLMSPAGDPGYPPLLPPPSTGGPGPGELMPAPHQPGPNQGHRQCPSREDKEFADFFKTIRDLTTDISAKEGEFPKECEVVREPYQPRQWAATDFHWKASGLCHKPLYFEDVQLERSGHTLHPLAQPVVSGAKFFLTVPMLPYKMGLEPPNECIYTLGHYRPGNCAPHLLDPIPLSVRAAMFQTGAVVGAAAIIP